MSPAVVNSTSLRPGSSKAAPSPKKSIRQQQPPQPQQQQQQQPPQPQKPAARKTRVTRRRPRARVRTDDLESDEEFVRDALSDDDGSVSGSSDADSDSMSDSDTASGTNDDSASDSELDGMNGHGRVRNGRNKGRRHLDTPSTTQSPPPDETAAGLKSLEVLKSDGGEKSQDQPAFLSSGIDWSDTALPTGVNGSDSVPVIDFAELDEHTAAAATTAVANSTKAKKARKAKRAASETAGSTVEKESARVDPVEEGDEDSQKDAAEKSQRGGRGGSRGVTRPRGQSARQAYQQRLQTDPSFVPTVGEFWGHDDRLLQKDLRSLSGWWRGRWRGRGRGGFAGQGMRGGRGRGRGGFVHGTDSSWDNGNGVAGEGEGWPTADAEPELLPIDKAWTHDGFEELKKNDEQKRDEQKRRPSHHNQHRFNLAKPMDKKAPVSKSAKVETESISEVVPSSPALTNASHQFRTSTPTRGRGRGGSVRGKAIPMTSRVRAELLGEPWFSMKPERIWTKQFEGYLYSDPALKPKLGRPAGIRVTLPGKEAKVVPEQKTKTVSAEPEIACQTSESTFQTIPSSVSDAGVKKFIVKMPTQRQAKEKEQIQVEATSSGHQSPLEVSVEAVQQLTPTEPLQTIEAPPSEAEEHISESAPEPEPAPVSSPVQKEVMATPSLTRDNSLSEKSFGDAPNLSTLTSALTLDTKALPEVAPIPSGPMPPMQAPYPVPMQPSPTYTSPYVYPHALPPGIALTQQGYAYEVASGRPVYLHPTPPPMPMYNPRPIPFVPGHMHHPSSMSDYMPGPATPPINGIYDPQTGQPIFSLPRQNSRIEIRAPSEAKPGKSERRPSTLRRTTTAEQQDLQEEGSQSNSYSLQASQVLAPVQYVRPHEFYPDMSGMAHNYQPSEGSSSLSPGNEERMLAVQAPPPMDPSMMGYNPYLSQQQYYYPEQYYPPYVDMTQVPHQPIQQPYGQYDTYATDPHQQAPVYF